MKKQPAEKSYFFDKGYRDVARVMRISWKTALNPVKNEISRVSKIFSASIFNGIITLICDLFVFGIITAFILSFNTVLSVLFLSIIAVTAVLVYLGFTFAALFDFQFCLLKKFSNICPHCQSRFMMPTYQCGTCGALHTQLRPSKYGILKRRCKCGTKLPTTFFNGRQKLLAVCPNCFYSLKDGGQHREISIPVVGGPSSGKTCFITTAISQIGKIAPANRLVFSYSPITGDDYQQNAYRIEQGERPAKTSDTRLKYYQFYLTPVGAKYKNLISICDVAGEIYENTYDIEKQIGFKHSDGFILIIDPLSLYKYRHELMCKGSVNLHQYGVSMRSVEEVLDVLIDTLENMRCVGTKNAVNADVAVVFTKCDIPGLADKIGSRAVSQYAKAHHVSKYDAQNAVCKQFLEDYEEDNFLNRIYSKFRTVQFFTCSALGHNENGCKFVSSGVEEPILWMIDKASSSINLSQKWGKKI